MSSFPPMEPGAVTRVKAFTANYHDQDGRETLSLSYKRSQAKKNPGHYFVIMMLGVDDGPHTEDAVDHEKLLRAFGWGMVDEVVDKVLEITKDHKGVPRDMLVDKVVSMLNEK